ncbi:DNA (cytosine-5-)-methyltransferase [Marinobacter nauticus]|uniref:DNA (cytosine-5-)-methyltransferase n=1 Tax=Marinobacter nauticus TaxID=2743 RepID=UPI001C5746E0|nr:DNA (cytosine-5-)-methyltransferase [Marinobacter nauticus]MBW3198999.1 DNA (cytosine-5-)-methyltransferase [Marinobacter nauticus]MBY6184409.1 DNA (cytosine-5-)-methyltransferase [Marinobacter nauticus]MBY6220016.1 DNA (cytosine-5-)-methyltransferase [Marinobacter nauticus]
MDSVQEKKQFADQSQKDSLLINQVAEIYDPKFIVETLQACGDETWSRERLKKLVKSDEAVQLSESEARALQELLPKPFRTDGHEFRFIDLFAGIGGIRRGFEEIGGKCVFTSEWNKYAVRTYKANHYSDPDDHVFNEDIREVTLSGDPDVDEETAYSHIDEHVPDHDVLLAGFPCQPFSLAGVSKKNSLGRKHGFECDTQGTLFFDVARILKAKRPAAFLLENVKNLKSHDKGKTFKVILETLDELGYEVADVNFNGSLDPKVIDARHFVPQHRERIVLVGFRRDLDVHDGFTLKDIELPDSVPTFGDILEPADEVDDKYILTPKLWKYLFDYAAKHREKGNGFGFGLTGPNDVARTLSARYHKDGSEILVDRGWDMDAGFEDIINQGNRPRRLTPKECARLMGFDGPNESNFKVPVSDTQAYRQFGNSVAVPVFRAVAKLMRPRILQAIQKQQKKNTKAA